MDNKPAFITSFIEIYKTYPCLWKTKHHDYTNKEAKEQAYSALRAFYADYTPIATVDTVKKKINNLRSAFRKELKKVKSAEERGFTYRPSLWYYELLLFTVDQEDDGDLQYVDDDSSSCVTIIKCEDTSLHSNSPPQSLPYLPYAADITQPEKFVCPKEESYSHSTANEPIYDPPAKQHKSSEMFQPIRGNDEFDGIALNVACKLRRMPEEQGLYAEMLINKLLFHGLKGTIQQSTDLVDLL